MPKQDHYAILVAINFYPGIGNLKGPENDANDFRNWLLDPDGGDVAEENIKLICSSDFAVVEDPYDASPTETNFKKALDAWLKVNSKTWRERVGERLYLFLAGHGFTSGSISQPALFTAQASASDTAHIAAYHYAAKIQNAGFFDELVFVMDCCQDVLKASAVNEPTWLAPDRERQTLTMNALGAPRGKKAYEANPHAPPPIRGFFSSVFLEALRTAPNDEQG
jgi:uncharacterized caspase-like protein